MSNRLPILPGTPAQRVNEQIIPYIPGTAPILPEDQITRANQISVNIEDDIKPFSLGLQDIDEAVFYYFNNVIQPSVIQNGNKVAVPVTYASQERWAAVQADGYYRDKNGKLMYPIVLVQRTGFEKNRTLANKLDGNNVNNFSVSKARYNSQNQYTKFDLLNNYTPSEKFYLSPVPDYVNITYNCVVFTNYIQENNKIVESIEFASDSYWGNKDYFQFRAYIDRFDTTAEYAVNEERVAKTSFSITLYGYIVPDTINRDLATNGKRQFFSKSVVSIVAETAVGTSFQPQRPVMGPTPSITPTISVTPSLTPSISVTPSITPTISVTPSITPSISLTPSISVSNTPSVSLTPSISTTPSTTPSISISTTPGLTVTPTPSLTPTPSTSTRPNTVFMKFDII